MNQASQKITPPMEIMGPAKAPDLMIDRCTDCHSESYARRELEKGDELLKKTDFQMALLIDLTNTLYQYRIIDDKTRFSYFREGTSHRFSVYKGGFHKSAKFSWNEG